MQWAVFHMSMRTPRRSSQACKCSKSARHNGWKSGNIVSRQSISEKIDIPPVSASCRLKFVWHVPMLEVLMAAKVAVHVSQAPEDTPVTEAESQILHVIRSMHKSQCMST